MFTKNLYEIQKKPLTVIASGEGDWGNGDRERIFNG